MTEEHLRELLRPFVSGQGSGTPHASGEQSSDLPEDIYAKLAAYLDLLLRWNARTNLTAIRAPEEIVRRHFGESIFAAQILKVHIPSHATLLDVGSGAGFPGVPVQLVIPALAVTLAESQGKKAVFLREVTRVLGLPTEVWGGRVEALPPQRRFKVVALRAVDDMSSALRVGAERVQEGGFLLELSGKNSPVSATLKPLQQPLLIPMSEQRMVRLWTVTT